MKITIIYDNTAYEKDLKAAWGFSALVEVEDTPKLLFDTGGSGRTLLHNMQRLNIVPSAIDEVIISHPHGDHTGGLAMVQRHNKNLKIWVPASYRRVRGSRDIVIVDQARQLHNRVYTTGELKGVEQSLVITTDSGMVVIVGCSHSGVEEILTAARQFGTQIKALIGGLHGFNNFSLLENIELVCPTHCTRYKDEIRAKFPKKYEEGGVGRIFTF